MESRMPPQNLEAEQSVLGSVLLDNDVYARIEGTLRAEQFYKEGHRKIFRCMERLFRRGDPTDLVTLTEELRQSGDLESVGSVPYLIGLADSVPTAAYAENYARIVAEKAVLRDLIATSGTIMQTAFDQSMPIEQILDKAEASIFDLAGSRRSQDFQGMGELVNDTFAYINELFANPDPVSGLRTGFKELDQLTAGLQPSSLNVLAARPSMGKTALGLSIAQNVALREGKPVGLFSLEMSSLQLVTRMLCSEARVDMSRVRNGQLSDRDFQRLADTAGRMSEAQIFIDDNADMTVMELRSRARRLVSEHGAGLIMIDYLQLMSGGNSENRQQEISNISRGLKALARELDVPVLVLSQLSRAVEARPNKRPMLSDLRECVTGDTLVVLSDGRRVPISELEGTTPEVVALGVDGKLTVARSDKVWKVGTREVFELKLASGRRIRATGKHRLLTADGWRTLNELAVGDRLAIARLLPQPRSAEAWPDSSVALLGQLIGDGSYLKGQPLRYSTASEENSRVVEEGALALGSTVRRYKGRKHWHQLLIGNNGNRWHACGVGGWLKELGIFGQRSHQKRVPEAAFELASAQVALLLRHMWAADGCIHTRKDGQRGSQTVYYGTNSEGLAYDVAALLLRLGIVARIKSVQKEGYRPGFQVFVSGSSDQRRFLDNVGTFGPREKPGLALSTRLIAISANPNVDTVPREIFSHVSLLMARQGLSRQDVAALRGLRRSNLYMEYAPTRSVIQSYATALQDDRLLQLAANDLFWDSVVGISPAGPAVVYDITVPGPSSWLADSIVSHNSGAIEQDADLVMFIYRDEYYDSNSEKQGIAEVIIGKQRNGPVGTVDLQFHNAHVRFNDLARTSG
ncbi:MAG: replicative DNA helicase [Trueperaceae bacterium]